MAISSARRLPSSFFCCFVFMLEDDGLVPDSSLLLSFMLDASIIFHKRYGTLQTLCSPPLIRFASGRHRGSDITKIKGPSLFVRASRASHPLQKCSR
mmetsp:Transcript_22363/g.47126  ORF Transcript_22363/g.47126 Transcript_22363/m.47126 type:complete len:97 (-) Transcript_22363:87-377(-)